MQQWTPKTPLCPRCSEFHAPSAGCNQDRSLSRYAQPERQVDPETARVLRYRSARELRRYIRELEVLDAAYRRLAIALRLLP